MNPNLTSIGVRPIVKLTNDVFFLFIKKTFINPTKQTEDFKIATHHAWIWIAVLGKGRSTPMMKFILEFSSVHRIKFVEIFPETQRLKILVSQNKCPHHIHYVSNLIFSNKTWTHYI